MHVTDLYIQTWPYLKMQSILIISCIVKVSKLLILSSILLYFLKIIVGQSSSGVAVAIGLHARPNPLGPTTEIGILSLS